MLKADPNLRKRIIKGLEAIQTLEDPRTVGKALTGELRGFWRYRIGDYRVICELIDDALIILAVEVGHRRDIYEK
ncbi:type II toxin-antitoxin system RelE family toxin [Rothia terrae]|uniref:type II toxin-antitoxin system RelE family toxin n=1 Tax=Rothia terrae TaxID=396015 RepID=UPI0011AAB595|nr:type II toxin-antitoxin system RelE/ParE family toxin [Rothia terrae]MDT0189149.1 type II toxin-antitoxin system RelE/ParE family toxin [Rothia terrae]